MPRSRRGRRQKIDSTRGAVAGGTAFYDALVKAMATQTKSSNSYMVALTDGSDGHSKQSIEAAEQAIAASEWTLLIIGLQVDHITRQKCERLAKAGREGSMYMHAA